MVGGSVEDVVEMSSMVVVGSSLVTALVSEISMPAWFSVEMSMVVLVETSMVVELAGVVVFVGAMVVEGALKVLREVEDDEERVVEDVMVVGGITMSPMEGVFTPVSVAEGVSSSVSSEESGVLELSRPALSSEVPAESPSTKVGASITEVSCTGVIPRIPPRFLT